MRRLAEQGPFALERHTGGPEARASAPQAIALKREWIKHTGRLAPALADQRFAAFFADVAEGRVRPAGCGVTVLKSNGAPAGIAVDITCGERRAAHIIVHDPRLDSFSPGTLLLEAWIKGASADGIATFDLLAPAYAYKMDWADGTVAVGDFAQGLTLAGHAYVHLYLGLARRTAKAAAEALPHVLGRLRALVRRAAPQS
jgi:CelD/BcsL family acetyltransferase involved in cellulose biosynthesis